MRPQPDMPRPSDGGGGRRRTRREGSRFAGRGRLLVGIFLVGLFLVLVSLRGIASFYIDYLWFDSLDLASVWSRVIATQLSLALAGGLIFFVLCWVNLLIAERVAPVFRPSSGEDDLLERYHEIIGSRAWLVRMGVSLFLALFVGVSLGAAWNDWILFTNRVDFGQRDATFDTDIGFYVFQLPFLRAASGWLFSSLLVIFMITAVAHLVNGGIRFQAQLDRVTPQVKAHLSVLLGVLALVQTGRYWLSRYDLTFSTRGTVDGATYTDVNVELRSIYLLMLISLFAFGLFIANIWRRGWVLPGMAVGLWVLVAVIASGMVPAFVQRFRVEPNESTRERPYIVNNIAATREAYGLSDVDMTPYEWTQPLNAGDLADEVDTLTNVRLWDPASMQENFRRRQALRQFYEINDVDVDRYEIDGELTPVMIAARDLNSGGIPSDSWEARHLIYTNGLGVVAAKANDKVSSGDPFMLARDIPVRGTPDGLPEIDEPRIFFGEDKGGYVIVNTDVRVGNVEDELDETTFAPYDGDDGVRIGSGISGFVRRAAFALRYGDIEIVVSGNITPQSRVLVERDVTDRLESLAPFLAYDHDPYVVLVEGRIKYVVDAYTTTRNYPNAQRVDAGGLDPSSGLFGRSFNYARNSVKAVVDAYDGTVDLYVVDDEDPLIQAYEKAFPELFTPGDEMSDDLRAHLRYPEDLFTIQTQMWTRYHVENPNDFYDGRDRWNVPAEPGIIRNTGDTVENLGPDGQPLTADDRYKSQYTLMQLPGEDEASFVLLRPFVTATDVDDETGGQNQLRAFMVADSDPDSYGRLRTYLLPVSNLPDGPNLAADEIQADGNVGERIRALCTERTTCTFASPSIVPIGNSLLYVQSFLVAGTQQRAPGVEHVIVLHRRPTGESPVRISTSLRGALIELFGPDVPEGIEDTGLPGASPDPDDPDDPDGESGDPADPEDPVDDPDVPELTLTERESQLIDDLVAAFEEADALARGGDQVGWAQKIAEASAIAEELQGIRNETEGGSSDDPDATSNGAPPDPDVTTTTTAGA